MMITASSVAEEEINGEIVLMNAMVSDTAQEKITPAKESSRHGYLNIRAIYLHSSKGDTESTEFEMQEEQNASTRIRQSLPPRLWKSLVRPVATKEKS